MLAARVIAISDKLSKIQQRIESAIAGEALISALVAVVLLTGVVFNLPEAELKRTLMPTLRPLALATGTEQSWRMYSPDPMRQLETVEVHVTMDDGADKVWTLQRGDMVIGPFAWYHWQKLKENAVRDPRVRAGFAHWVVNDLTTPPQRPVRVHMTLRTELLPPPGNDGPRTTNFATLYDEDLTAQP